MKVIVVFIFLLFTATTHAQMIGNALVDSLIQELPGAKEDTNKVKLLNAISGELNTMRQNEGVKYGEQAILLAKKLQWKKGLANAYKLTGANYFYLGNYPKALENEFEVLKLSPKRTPIRASALSYIAMVYQAQKEYDKALDFFFQELEIARELKKKPKIAYALGNIGGTYHLMGKDSLAIEYYQQSLALHEENNEEIGIAATTGYMGELEFRQGKVNEGLYHLLKSLRLFEKYEDSEGVTVTAGNIGEAYLKIARGDIDVVRPDSLVPSSKRVARQKAYGYLKKALEISTAIGDMEEMYSGHKRLYEYYQLTGDDGRALENFQQYSILHDSVYSKENKLKIQSLEHEHELGMKKKEIELRDKEIQLNKLAVRKNRNEKGFLIGGLGILLVVIFFVMKERKKSEKLLLNILPPDIATRLKRKEHPIADHFSDATIIFIDMAEFTSFAEVNPPKETVKLLDNVFTKFDGIAEKYGLEKIKTIGDCYMAVSGLPAARADHALAAGHMALDIKRSMANFTTPDGTKILFRIGLDCGSVIAGVIGKNKFIYDLWGDSVNTASRMESTGIAGEIQCTDNFKQQTELYFNYVSRGLIDIKGKGKMETWLLQSEKNE